LAWIGLVVPVLRPLYDYAWFVGFGAAAITHYVLMKVSQPRMKD
jgi:NCS1 family nucleobase:cation symporter-1